MQSLSVRETLRVAYYQARLLWRTNWWLAPLVALLIPWMFYLPDWEEAERVYWALKLNENMVPLVGIVVCANLFSQEWENHTEALWMTRPRGRGGLLLVRAALALGYTSLVASVPLVVQYFSYVRFAWREMLLVVLAPTLFLGVVGMAVGLVGKNSAIAFLAPLAYWFFEMTTKGKYTGLLYLFSRASLPCANEVECEMMVAAFPWALSKGLVLGVSAVLLALSAGYLGRVGRRALW